MLCACENAQVSHLPAGQLATGQHALNGFHDDPLWVLAIKDIGFGFFFDPAGVAGVPVVFLVTLVASHLHFFAVDDDHVVAHIHVRREGGFVLAAQAHRDDRSKTTKNNAFSVNQDPFLVDIRRSCGKGFHITPKVWGGFHHVSFDWGGIKDEWTQSSVVVLDKHSKNSALQFRY